ncbi:hypothetical protein ACHAWF_006990 [Thalassiosira exigua]
MASTSRAARAALLTRSAIVGRTRTAPSPLSGNASANPVVVGAARPRAATSARTIARVAASFDYRRDVVARGSPSHNDDGRFAHPRQPRPPVPWTWSVRSGTSAPRPPDGTSDRPEGASDRAVASESGGRGAREEADAARSAALPLRRSRRTTSANAADGEGGKGFDDRARAKLSALSRAKEEAARAEAAFSQYAAGENDDDDEDAAELRERWDSSERALATAYSQAVKYAARTTKSESATQAAERLLFEWMDRFADQLERDGVGPNARDGPRTTRATQDMMAKKEMVRTMRQIVSALTGGDAATESNPSTSSSAVEHERGAAPSLLKILIPPPTYSDYYNLLRAYSLSKARRKGQQCEVVMANMLRLAQAVVNHYSDDGERRADVGADDPGVASASCGEERGDVPRWKLWAKDSVPNSKVFAFAIKCHAGSTHKQSLDRIIALNQIHDSVSESAEIHIPGMYRNDPYVRFHSIKSLKSLQTKEERDVGMKWLRDLHEFVTSPENSDYGRWTSKASESANDPSADGDENEERAPAVRPQTIDVTSAYTALIRLLAKLRGADGAAADAREILNYMHEVHNLFAKGAEDPDSRAAIASVEIRANAYNLVLGLYRDSKDSEDAAKAVELLRRMVAAGDESGEDRNGVPLPTEQSFEFAIGALANLSDGGEAIEEAERLIELMRGQEHVDPSVAAYNALIAVCNKQLFGKAELFDKALGVLDGMKEARKEAPGVTPTPETFALVMKACSLSEHGDHEKVLDSASKLFNELEGQESDKESAVALTDRAYFYMMKCTERHMVGDQDAKKERIMDLFSDACQRGLCSANVLTLFRNAVSEEEYRLTVGDGRLADPWIANVRGPRALYTDGSQGGAGKHARRKGKSTSDWAKKQRVKEAWRGKKREEKRAKKFFKGKGMKKGSAVA